VKLHGGPESGCPGPDSEPFSFTLTLSTESLYRLPTDVGQRQLEL